ncbi:MAG: hypothetical protein BGO11_06600 [Solirubrobacterales bacterium 70-9]|nr:MAG: hypothetical protein BGO11_06600 [Solirubrobacterales bacterium 70-9]
MAAAGPDCSTAVDGELDRDASDSRIRSIAAPASRSASSQITNGAGTIASAASLLENSKTLWRSSSWKAIRRGDADRERLGPVERQLLGGELAR